MNSIEPLLPEHFALAASWLAKGEINSWLTSDWRDRKVDTVLVAIFNRHRRNRLYLVRHGGQPCGLVGLADLDTSDKTAMIWYILGEQSLGGRGILSEAVSQLVKLSFRELGLASIYAWIMDGNTPSLRVLQKAGFREVGRIRKATSLGGRQVDRIYFDLITNDLPSI